MLQKNCYNSGYGQFVEWPRVERIDEVQDQDDELNEKSDALEDKEGQAKSCIAREQSVVFG